MEVGVSEVMGTPFRSAAPFAVRRDERTRVQRAPASLVSGAAALGLFVAISLIAIGGWALPNPAAGTLGTGPDVQLFVWGLRWWPYALGHGLNPLVSHVVWAPYGSPVLWTTTVPLLSLLAAPITLTAGPTVAWNVLCVLAPALSAWAAFLLCRELTGRWGSSVVGGALFGFSSYEFAEGMAHLQMTMLPCVPLAAWLVVRHVHGRLGVRGLAMRVVALAVAQFLISPEVLLTLVLAGAIGLMVAAAQMPRLRPRLRTAAGGVGLGLAGAALLLAPLLIPMLSHIPKLGSAVRYPADLANLAIPTRVTALGSAWARSTVQSFPGNAAEQGAYLGLPLLASLLAAIVGLRARARAHLLAVLLAVAVVLSLGSRLIVAGHPLVWLPGAVLGHIPLLKDAQPARLAAYTALLAGLAVAMWLAEGGARPWVRWLAVALALAALAPNPAAGDWFKPTPPAIAHGGIARAIPRGANVISLPLWNVADRVLYAQAAADMRFSLDDGWLQLMPNQYQRLSNLISRLSAAGLAAVHTPRQAAALEQGLCRLHVDYALVWTYGLHLLAGLRLTPIRAGNVLAYDLPRCHTV